MKTVNCILNREPDRGRGLPKVVDLAAWKAENLIDLDTPKADPLPERHRDRKPVRRGRRRLLDWAELAATLAVAAVLAALAVRVLI